MRSAHIAQSAVDQVFSPKKVMSEKLESLVRDNNWMMAQQIHSLPNALHHSHGVAITQVVKTRQYSDVPSAGLIYVQDISDTGRVLMTTRWETRLFLWLSLTHAGTDGAQGIALL